MSFFHLFWNSAEIVSSSPYPITFNLSLLPQLIYHFNKTWQCIMNNADMKLLVQKLQHESFFLNRLQEWSISKCCSGVSLSAPLLMKFSYLMDKCNTARNCLGFFLMLSYLVPWSPRNQIRLYLPTLISVPPESH